MKLLNINIFVGAFLAVLAILMLVSGNIVLAGVDAVLSAANIALGVSKQKTGDRTN